MSTNLSGAVALGPREIIQGLAAFGVEVRDVYEKSAVLVELRDIRTRSATSEHPTAVVFITESLVATMTTDEYQEILSNELPVVLTIPDLTSEPNAGLEKLRTLTKRAIGTDIFAGKE